MYSIITPYLVPINLNKIKNIGDAFIYDTCEKLIKKKQLFISLNGKILQMIK